MRFSKLAILALVLVQAISQGQTLRHGVVKCADESLSEGNRDEAAPDFDSAIRSARLSRIAAGLGLLRKVDNEIIRQFERAWRISGGGSTGLEGVVLIFHLESGSYRGHSLRATCEYKRFTFEWDPAAIAIVHTHPNSCDPKPSERDQRVAEKLVVPIFTITKSGMYVYDPETKITRKVLNGLDWLKLSKWTEDVHRNLIAGLFGEHKARLLHAATTAEAATHKTGIDASSFK
jgi:hypothetical protein